MKKIICLILTLFLISCAAPTSQEIPAGAIQVDIKDFAFNPDPIRIKAGQTIVWINQDSVGHTVTAVDGSWDSGDLFKGQSWSQTFNSAGEFEYYCALHPDMKGKVIVE